MWYIRKSDELTVFIYVQPGAKSTEIVGIHDGALKIRLNAPPIDGRANDALQKFLAKQFHVPASKVQLMHGEKSRKKKFVIFGTEVDPDSLYQTPQ
ncbi:DUF167 domain-containing protein [Legionella shakespearei]|uniref:UPF0235 protein Lsha_1778 n=1 Tax=Legionella shakespearei DSM 23087 TaxID=1122169 RepID=A0A0W0YT17_9GAMM|nr:DUF167 domain-containing protein [Legionella shakespearei]KTD60028.1 hypothetical protein Lsha_1778 [Legionella shakespearei DSM 23087]